MFIRTIKYTKLDESTLWPWLTASADVIPEVMAIENYIFMSPTVGLLTRSVEETSNTYTYTMIFEDEDAFNAHTSTDAHIAMIKAIEENMATRNITKTASSVSE